MISFLEHIKDVPDQGVAGMVTYPLSEVLLATWLAFVRRGQLGRDTTVEPRVPALVEAVFSVQSRRSRKELRPKVGDGMEG